MINITPWTEEKFLEKVQRIYNAIFVSVYQLCLTRTKGLGENSTWINELNQEHQKELSKAVGKMEVVPLGQKIDKLSQIKDYKSSWQHVQPQVNYQKGKTLQEEKK